MSEERSQSSSRRTKAEDEDVIKPHKYSDESDDCMIFDKTNPMEKLMGGDRKRSIEKRERVNSGSIIKNDDSYVSQSTISEDSYRIVNTD